LNSIRNKHIAPFCVFILILANTILAGQEINTTEVHIKLLTKVMAMDKNFNLESGRDNVKIGIIFSGKNRNSVKVKNEVLTLIKKSQLKVKDIEIDFIELNLGSYKSIEDMIKLNELEGIFITPLRGYDINEITRICKKYKVISFTNDIEFTEHGVSITFDIADKKTKILINIDSAEAEGAKFSSNLLKIVEIVDKKRI